MFEIFWHYLLFRRLKPIETSASLETLSSRAFQRVRSVSSRFGSFRRPVAPGLPQILYSNPGKLKDAKKEVDCANRRKHDAVRKTDPDFRHGTARSLLENLGIRREIIFGLL